MTKTVEIITDVTVTYFEDSDFAEFLYEMEVEKRDREIEEELLEYLATHSPEDEDYSDIYKEVYGVRPRFY